jgi:hypothetical protein
LLACWLLPFWQRWQHLTFNHTKIMSGKGSSPRPFEVSQDEYSRRWEQIFGHKKAKSTAEQPADTSPCDTTQETDKENQHGNC